MSLDEWYGPSRATMLAREFDRKLCVCGHARQGHGEEPPYECECLAKDGTTFRCDCRGFTYKPEAPEHSDDGTRKVDMPGEEWTVSACKCGAKFVEPLELRQHIEGESDVQLCEECGHEIRLHADRYGCEYERGDAWVTGNQAEAPTVLMAQGPCQCMKHQLEAARAEAYELNGKKDRMQLALGQAYKINQTGWRVVLRAERHVMADTEWPWRVRFEASGFLWRHALELCKQRILGE